MLAKAFEELRVRIPTAAIDDRHRLQVGPALKQVSIVQNHNLQALA